MMNPTMFLEDGIGDTALKCPHCEVTKSVHPTGFAIFYRTRGEDSPAFLVEGESAYSSKEEEAPTRKVSLSLASPEDTPHRRDSFMLFFHCGHCGEDFSLDIFQHKGPTLFSYSAEGFTQE